MKSKGKMKQYEAVIETMEKFGGLATLGDLNQEVFKIQDCVWNTKTPFASIRRIVQTTKGIYKIKPGLYGLESHRKELEANGYVVETEHNKDSETMNGFNHSYYQGILLKLGVMNAYDTYIPEQDKNKVFLNKGIKLKDLRTLQSIPPYSYEELVKRSSTIDVIWFNERRMPSSFFEIEHSTDIQNSLLKFNDLQDFYVQMFIVADNHRRDEYERKLNYSAFSTLRERKRVNFLSYVSLVKQYEQAVERQSLDMIIH